MTHAGVPKRWAPRRVRGQGRGPHGRGAGRNHSTVSRSAAGSASARGARKRPRHDDAAATSGKHTIVASPDKSSPSLVGQVPIERNSARAGWCRGWEPTCVSPLRNPQKKKSLSKKEEILGRIGSNCHHRELVGPSSRNDSRGLASTDRGCCSTCFFFIAIVPKHVFHLCIRRTTH